MERWLFAALCVFSSAVLVYLPVLRYPLLYDDVAAVERNPDVFAPFSLRSLLTNDFWGTPLTANFSHKSYRPLTVLTFRLTGDVYRQRILNIALHVLNSLLLGVLVQRYLGPRNGKLCAGLFCIHPIHVEAVVQLVGRAELLCASFFLSCLLSPSYPSACVLAVLATLCKEQGLTALVVKVSLDLAQRLNKRNRHGRIPWREILLSTMVTIALLGARLTISGQAPTFHKLDNPVRLLDSPFRQINLAYLPVFNFHLLLYPLRQSCDYTFNSLPLIRKYSDVRVLQVGVFVLSGLVAAATLLVKIFKKTAEDEKLNNNYIAPKYDEGTRTSNSIAISALVMTIVPWLPGSNILFYVGFVVAERVLYLPSMGVCFLVVLGLSKLSEHLPKQKTVLRGALVVLCVCLLMKSSIRGRQWQSGTKLFTSAVRVFPENIKMWNSLGKAYETEGNFHLALSCFDRSASIYDDLRSKWYKAKLLAKLDKNEIAKAIYQKEYPSVISRSRESNGSHIRKEEILFVVDYVRLLIEDDALREARTVVEDMLAIFPRVAELNVAAGELFYNLNEKIMAEESYRRALEAAPRTADVYYNLGVLLMERGATDKAADMFRKCVEINPQHEPSRVNLNVLRTNTEDSEMMRLSRDAMDALREGAYSAAESLLHRVLSRNPHHPSALYNLALLQTQVGKPPAVSLSFIDRLLSVRPSHSKGLLLKANIVHRQLRDLDAAVELYAKAYSVDHNLESALEALCDLSPSKAFQLGGSCHRDVEIETDASERTQAHDIPFFDRRQIDL
ncbi:protein O-mannosyl-transferase TMTC3 [Galendromus occidentalis]|uniref:dolichyl-phosphate-mannose--protein mannosyltransferase n=1 Tax=Galendromus occidentalis TaxID=34638 RepID=A0AAJ6QYF8_9ACAR|nr:protein O-mannosyl-transferase TMTC3 [Galendromus occidentalis]